MIKKIFFLLSLYSILSTFSLQADIPYLDRALDYANGSWGARGAAVAAVALVTAITIYILENEEDQNAIINAMFNAAILSGTLIAAFSVHYLLKRYAPLARCAALLTFPIALKFLIGTDYISAAGFSLACASAGVGIHYGIAALRNK